MKHVKKVLATVLALTMMLCMSVTVFAAGKTTDSDQNTVTITKKYKATNEGTTSPAETFTVEQIGNGVVKDGEAASAPALGTIIGADFEAGDASTDGTKGTITITLPEYTKVGVYEYTLREVSGTTAGVTYYGSDIKLVVTVIQDTSGKLRVATVHTEEEGNVKSDTFENTYSAGTLSVTKTVTGNLGDQEKKFNFAVTFTKPEGKNVDSTIAATVAGQSVNFNPTWEDGTYTYEFQLAHDETASFSNIPYGVSYEVVETEAEGYTTTKTGDRGDISSASVTAAFENDKSGTVDTGINLDNIPYILVFAVVVVAAFAVFAARRRRFQD